MLVPRQHLQGEARTQFARELQQEYYAGASLRDLVRRYNTSYGRIQKLLRDVNTTMRPRGGRRGGAGKARKG